MQLLFEEDLVEGVVSLATMGLAAGSIHALQIRRFHTERDRAYAVLDPDARQQAFARVHSDWFNEWGFAPGLRAAVSGFPQLARSLDALAFRKARRPADEGSELYCNTEGRRRGIVALHVERFHRDAALTPFLNHELMHLHDMVDPAFGYAAELDLPRLSTSQERLVRERYRLLWNVTVDGRLTASHRPTIAVESRRRAEFDRAFGFLPPSTRVSRFDQLWTDPTPRHDRLLAMASDPRELGANPLPQPGASCPLCGFATFDWADPRITSDELIARIHREFPGWKPAMGLCARCLEVCTSARLDGSGAICGLETHRALTLINVHQPCRADGGTDERHEAIS